MEFTCTHCNKPIKCMAVIIDNHTFAHLGCEGALKITLDRAKIVEQWEKHGFLDGLKSNKIDNLIP